MQETYKGTKTELKDIQTQVKETVAKHTEKNSTVWEKMESAYIEDITVQVSILMNYNITDVYVRDKLIPPSRFKVVWLASKPSTL